MDRPGNRVVQDHKNKTPLEEKVRTVARFFRRGQETRVDTMFRLTRSSGSVFNFRKICHKGFRGNGVTDFTPREAQRIIELCRVEQPLSGSGKLKSSWPLSRAMIVLATGHLHITGASETLIRQHPSQRAAARHLMSLGVPGNADWISRHLRDETAGLPLMTRMELFSIRLSKPIEVIVSDTWNRADTRKGPAQYVDHLQKRVKAAGLAPPCFSECVKLKRQHVG